MCVFHNCQLTCNLQVKTHLAAVKLFLVLWSCQIPRHTWPIKSWLNLIGWQYSVNQSNLTLLLCDVISLSIYDVNNNNWWRHWLNWRHVPDAILYISVTNLNATGAQFSQIAGTWNHGLDSHISQGIDRSVETNNNLARQDGYTRNSNPSRNIF